MDRLRKTCVMLITTWDFLSPAVSVEDGAFVLFDCVLFINVFSPIFFRPYILTQNYLNGNRERYIFLFL